MTPFRGEKNTNWEGGWRDGNPLVPVPKGVALKDDRRWSSRYDNCPFVRECRLVNVSDELSVITDLG